MSARASIGVRLCRVLVVAVLFAGPGHRAFAATATVAVATNFARPLEALTAAFRARTGHDLVVSSGATGKLYAQIREGAPFDVFLAADEEKPTALVEQGLARPESRFTYAEGRIVLWSSDARGAADCRALLDTGTGKIALANPAMAPYGVAAGQTLRALGLSNAIQGRLVLGENIGQAFAFVETGNAIAGFVALAQMVDRPTDGKGCRWDVPASMHEPIAQQAVLLTRGADNEAARAFLDFLQGDEAKAVIRGFGYAVE